MYAVLTKVVAIYPIKEIGFNNKNNYRSGKPAYFKLANS